MIDKTKKPTKLLWLDLEMTGLDPQKDRIIEVAIDVTDFEFNTLASYESVIKQDDATLALMNEWAAKQHGISGLTEKVKKAEKTEEEVKHEIVGFIQAQFGPEPAVLAGNSIHNDRLFIRQWWPEVETLLHYRMLDVSSWKIIMQGKYNQEFKKPEVHRAYEDIQGSIAELQHYLDWFKKYDGSQDG